MGPEYRLTKSDVASVQRDERQCEFFLWTKLGGNVQRISFTYIASDGQADSDTPRIENVKIVINPQKPVPTATIVGVGERQQSVWQLEMSIETYDANRKCLPENSISQKAAR